MKKIIGFFYYFIIFLIGISVSFIIYDRKYLKSKWFKKPSIIYAPGWSWVVKDFMGRIFLHKNVTVNFPISPFCTVINYKNILFDPDQINIFQMNGSYFQAWDDAKIIIGKNVWIAPNTGIITTNHDLYDPNKHSPGKDIIIGDDCWIGMNSVILPGVVIGKKTVVGAGSIVTESFPEGKCVIAGNPAKIIKNLDFNDDSDS